LARRNLGDSWKVKTAKRRKKMTVGEGRGVSRVDGKKRRNVENRGKRDVEGRRGAQRDRDGYVQSVIPPMIRMAYLQPMVELLWRYGVIPVWQAGYLTLPVIRKAETASLGELCC
jgi:hypothetical protein